MVTGKEGYRGVVGMCGSQRCRLPGYLRVLVQAVMRLRYPHLVRGPAAVQGAFVLEYFSEETVPTQLTL